MVDLYRGMPLFNPKVAVVAEGSYSRTRREAATAEPIMDERASATKAYKQGGGDSGRAVTGSQNPLEVSKLTYKQPRVIGLYRGDKARRQFSHLAERFLSCFGVILGGRVLKVGH